ncbi:UDP-N-acetylmuramoyl-L-alanine--D-glutamate ligase [Candidatus Uabimicrobium sp. HlEnr_7]|uniref:UDP-N-acetylmuramoyl-L-alanine--D-glutamate ligase n=1 Tax=Candidatus Uabimicrobium helgolandensis TaxID=3095367 RepID=UPI0035581C98
MIEQNKNIAIWGWGKEGIAAARFLQKRNINFTLLNDEDPETHSFLENVKDVVVGKEIQQKIKDFDVVIKSPGVSLYRKEIQQNKNRVHFTSVTNLWFELYGSRFTTIIITGTKGKSTTASLFAHILRNQGFAVTLAGNIGQPLLGTPLDSNFYVIELSSYQAADLKYSASINILLNLYPEHLDWHKSVAKYFHDKTSIFRLNGTNIVNADCMSENTAYSNIYNTKDSYHATVEGIFHGKNRIISCDEISLEGVHNYTNICAIFTAFSFLNLPVEKIKTPLKTFTPLEHRLQKIETPQGIYVSDSISTTPESTIAAIETFSNYRVTLILGGQDRGLDWKGFAKKLQNLNLHFIITTYQSGKKIYDFLQKLGYKNTTYIDELGSAILLANKVNTPSGIILFSPAAPSYDAFTNYKEKGDFFVHQVKANEDTLKKNDH